MSIVYIRKTALWILALALALGIFVLLAPEAKADLTEIEDVIAALHDNGMNAALTEYHPSRNAGNYEVEGGLQRDGNNYTVTIRATAPLVVYKNGALVDGKHIGVMIRLPKTLGTYEVMTPTSDPLYQQLSDSTSAITSGADATVAGRTFVWWPNTSAAPISTTGSATIRIKEKLDGGATNIASLTVNFVDYNTDSDPLAPIYDVLDDANATAYDDIYDEIIGLTSPLTDILPAIIQGANGEAALKRLEDYYNRTIVAAAIANVGRLSTRVEIEPGTVYPASADKAKITAAGATLYAQPGEVADLWFSTPDKPALLSGEAGGIAYDKSSARQVDINLFARYGQNAAQTNKITTLPVPIIVSMPIPAGFDASKLMILQYGNDFINAPKVLPMKIEGGMVTFAVTTPGVYAFVQSSVSITTLRNRQKPAIVPMMYDVVKTGDSFSFKVIVMNGPDNMAGSTVSVKLNDKYSTHVTIGQDGVGHGTIIAPNFTGTTIALSGQVNGVNGGVANQHMILTTSGEIVRQ